MIEIIPIDKMKKEVSREFTDMLLYGLGLAIVGGASIKLIEEYLGKLNDNK